MTFFNTTGVCLILAFLFIAASCNENGDREPADSEQEMPELTMFEMKHNPGSLLVPSDKIIDPEKLPQELQHESVMSYRLVEKNEELPQLHTFEPEEVFELSLADDIIISAEVIRNREQVTGIAGITAEIKEPHSGFVSFTVQEGRLTGNIDLLSENRLFHLRYDKVNQQHYLAEINRDKLDVLPGSEPLVPPGSDSPLDI